MYTQTKICEAKGEGIVVRRLLIVEGTLITDHALMSKSLICIIDLVRSYRDVILSILFLVVHDLEVESNVMIADTFYHLRRHCFIVFHPI